MKRIATSFAAAAVLLAAALIADKATQQRHYALPNRISEGRTQLPKGWRITPAGTPIGLPGDLPMKMIVTGDNKLIVNTAGWHDHSIDVMDLKTEKLEQSFDVAKNWDDSLRIRNAGVDHIGNGGVRPSERIARSIESARQSHVFHRTQIDVAFGDGAAVNYFVSQRDTRAATLDLSAGPSA